MDNLPTVQGIIEHNEIAGYVQDYITCPRCGEKRLSSAVDTHLCEDCANEENQRAGHFIQANRDWIAEAKEQGIDPWLLQPGETQWEYSIWTAYRDCYPGKRPKLVDIARQMNTTYNAVKKIAARWNFPARLQLWIAECDRLTIAQRHSEILDMNQQHIKLANSLRDKLAQAIDNINPLELKPRDISSLVKASADLERRARLDVEAQEESLRQLSVGEDNAELRKVQPKQGDLQEILQVLAAAGVIAVGIKETTKESTTTREIIANKGGGG